MNAVRLRAIGDLEGQSRTSVVARERADRCILVVGDALAGDSVSAARSKFVLGDTQSANILVKLADI